MFGLKKFQFNKKKFQFKKKNFKIKKYYTKLIPFVYKKGFKIKKYYTKNIPFVYYTRKKKVRRKSYFWGTDWKWLKKKNKYLKKKRFIRVWFWRKKKIKKQWRLWHNFFFFFKQHWHDNLFKFKIRKRWLKDKKKNIKWVIPKWLPKKKLIIRSKDVYKKKLYFRKFLVKYYNFRRLYQFKNLYNKIHKKPGNKIINLYIYLESQLSSICVRMHFFWTLQKSKFWINSGIVYVNGKSINSHKHSVKINDLVSVIFPFFKLKKYIIRMYGIIKRHSKRQVLLNCAEINYKCISGILFFLPYKVEDLRLTLKKKRKHWIKTKVFSFLVNSFH